MTTFNYSQMPSATSLSTLEALGMQTRSLMEELEEIFPTPQPTPDQSIESIMYKAGQHSVVAYIQQRLEN